MIEGLRDGPAHVVDVRVACMLANCALGINCLPGKIDYSHDLILVFADNGRVKAEPLRPSGFRCLVRPVCLLENGRDCSAGASAQVGTEGVGMALRCVRARVWCRTGPSTARQHFQMWNEDDTTVRIKQPRGVGIDDRQAARPGCLSDKHSSGHDSMGHR